MKASCQDSVNYLQCILWWDSRLVRHDLAVLTCLMEVADKSVNLTEKMFNDPTIFYFITNDKD